MFKRTKLSVLIICLFLVISMITGCSNQATSSTSTPSTESASATPTPETVSNLNSTGFPIANEQITLTVFGSRDQNQAEWKNVYVLKEYEKLTNVKMEYLEVPAQGFDEKKNLLFASNELPDIFIRSNLTTEEIQTYGVSSGQLLALDNYLEQYAPNLNKILSENKVIMTSLKASNGKIYTLPALDFSDSGRMGFKQWINTDWLTAVGKNMPTTTDELRDVLTAFRDKDPNKNGIKDEIPLGVREPSSIYTLGGSFGLEYQMNNTVNIKDGKVHFWLTDDNFKEYLQFMNSLYKDKLLWQDYYKNDRPAWRSNLSNALFGMMYMPYSDVFINVEDQYNGVTPLIGPHGDQIWSDAKAGVGNIGSFAISSTCKYPEIALRWVDYFYSEEGSLFFRYGKEGETFYYDNNKMPQINEDILKSSKGFMTALGEINLVPGGGFPCIITNNTDGIVASKKTKEISAMHMPYLPKQVYSNPSFGQEDSDRVVAITQDLNKYRDEAVTKFILGEWDFNKWDEYCNTINKIGLTELESIYQKAFDKIQGK